MWSRDAAHRRHSNRGAIGWECLEKRLSRGTAIHIPAFGSAVAPPYRSRRGLIAIRTSTGSSAWDQENQNEVQLDVDHCCVLSLPGGVGRYVGIEEWEPYQRQIRRRYPNRHQLPGGLICAEIRSGRRGLAEVRVRDGGRGGVARENFALQRARGRGEHTNSRQSHDSSRNAHFSAHHRSHRFGKEPGGRPFQASLEEPLTVDGNVVVA